MRKAQTAKLAYTLSEVSQLTSVGRSLLYEEIKAQRLKTRKVGRRRIVTSSALTEWLGEAPAPENKG
jgi:excisionase family DNA binding protein